MKNTFFSSDLHFGHANIIKYCNRPYSSVEEMNEAIVSNFNNVVSKNDLTFFLGDMLFSPFDLDRLNGKKVLILGNHDTPANLSKYFSEMRMYMELRDILPKKKPIVLMHYPIESWNGKFHGSLHLHGHSHGTTDNTGLLRFDVGVDCWDMKPISIDSILEMIPKRKEEALLVEDSRDRKFKDLNERADYDAILEKVAFITQLGGIGSCTCMTKGPMIEMHKEDCRYRLINEAGSEIRTYYTGLK